MSNTVVQIKESVEKDNGGKSGPIGKFKKAGKRRSFSVVWKEKTGGSL